VTIFLDIKIVLSMLICAGEYLVKAAYHDVTMDFGEF
jgi:hypothetical protein